jgi:hypothetical protein
MGRTVRPSGAFFDPSIGRPDSPAHTKKLWDWMAGLVICARQIGHHHKQLTTSSSTQTHTQHPQIITVVFFNQITAPWWFLLCHEQHNKQQW